MLPFRGADVRGITPPFPPRGPCPSSARLLNFFKAGSGRAFRLMTGATSTGAGEASIEGFDSSWDRSESFRASSLALLDC